MHHTWLSSLWKVSRHPCARGRLSPIWTNLASKLIPFLRLLLNLRGITVGSTTPSIALERVMDRRAAARAVEQRFQSNPRALVWTNRWETAAYFSTHFEKAPPRLEILRVYLWCIQIECNLFSRGSIHLHIINCKELIVHFVSVRIMIWT